MNEPTTTISTVDYTIGYAPDPPDNRLNILSPIIAPQGPVELRRVSGPSEFQRLYFGGRSVKSTDNFSAIYARGLVSNAPIWIKRGVRDNLKGGLSSSTGQEIFTDSELNLITGIKAKFEFNTNSGSGYVPYDTAKSNLIHPQESNPFVGTVEEDHYDQLVFTEQLYDGSKIAITNDNKTNYQAKFDVDRSGTITTETYSILSVSEDGRTFTLTGDSTVDIPVGEYSVTFIINPALNPPLPQYTVTDKMVYSIFGLGSISTLTRTSGTESKVKTTLILNNETTNDVTLTILNKQFRIPNHTKVLDSLIQQLSDAKMLPQLISVDNAFSEPSFLTVSDGIVNFGNKGIRGIAWTSNFGIFISDSTAGISVNHPEEGSQTTIYQAPLKSAYEYQESYPITDPKLDVITEEGVKYCFYAGNAIADGDINTYFTGTQTFDSLFENLIKYGSDLLKADSSSGNSIVFPYCTSISYSDANTTEAEVDTSLLIVTPSSINDIVENDKFAVIAAFPCESNAISCEIREGDQEEVYRLTVNYGTDSEIWDIAFDSAICNGYGESLYYTRVNEQSSYIRVVELNGPSVSYQVLQFGDEITSQYCDTKEIQAALEYMKENDESNVDFDYITDGGLINNSLSKYILQLCEYYNSFYPVSVKTNSTLTVDYLQEFRAGLGDTARGRFIANTQRASILDNGSIEMPASYFYLVYRINLGNTVREFVKVMEETNGDIGMQNPIQKFSKITREMLLDNQIVTLKKGRNGAWFLNECLTLYNVDSYLQEDGTVLMVNKVNQLARAYADPLKGQDNTPDLRSSVESELLRIINDRLRTGTKYGPINMRVVCNDSNNPASLQNQRKLRIDIYATFSRSIKDVLIYTNVIPLT